MLYRRDVASLGIWFSDIPRVAVIEAARYIFRKHREILRIRYWYSREPFGVSKEINHFRIPIPQTQEELMQQMGRHERQNINNKLRKLQAIGATFHHYDADYNNPEVVEALTKYFELKKSSHNVEYNLTCKQHIQIYHVSDIYTMKHEGKIIAVRLTCEQCPVVYGENTTFDRDYSKYYLGIVMQYHTLSELVRKGKRELYLGASYYEGQRLYKQHFGSIEETAYHGIIYRNALYRLMYGAYDAIKSSARAVLPSCVWKFLKSCLKR